MYLAKLEIGKKTRGQIETRPSTDGAGRLSRIALHDRQRTFAPTTSSRS